MTVEKWAELHELIDALLEGQITEAQAEQLSVWLSIDDEAQRVYLQALDLHANLLWDLGGGNVVGTLTAAPTSAAQGLAASESALPGLAGPNVAGPVDVGPVNAGPVDAGQPATAFGNPETPGLLSRSAGDKGGFGPTASGSPSYWRQFFGTPQISIAAAVCVLLAAFTVVAAGERILRAVLSGHAMSPNDAGGVVKSDLELSTGASFRGTRRIGSSLYPGVGLANVLVFRLPALQEFECVRSVRLEWTYKARNGQPDFNLDLYGLGYVSSTSSLGGCFWEGDRDTALRTSYGMNGSGHRPVSLIAKSVMSPSTPTGRIVVEGPYLVRFMQSLYNEGGKEGDLAVFRLNADASTLDITRQTGYEVVHPPEVEGRTVPAEFPSLHIVADHLNSGGSSVAEVVLTAHGVESNRLLTTINSLGEVQGGSNHRLGGVRTVGSASWSGVSHNNLLVFRLPPLAEFERVRFARLEWTLKRSIGEPDFSVDLYGLGFVSSLPHALDTPFWEGGDDSRRRLQCGMEGRADRRVALVARAVMTPHSPFERIVVEGPELVAFLQSLYDDGAQGGELTVFRLNADVPTTDLAGLIGYQVVHPPEVFGKTVPAEFPLLRLIAY